MAVGQMVLTLISQNERVAVFDAPEKLLNTKTEAPPVKESLISDPSVRATGTVREVTPSADPIARTFRVKVTLDDGGRKMPFGAAIVGSIALSRQNLVKLPASALTNEKGQTAVFLYDRATSKLTYRPIHIARFDDRNVYVASGLSDGDIVATAGVSKLRNGEEVKLDEGAK